MDFIQSSIAYLPGAAAILLIWAFFKHSKRHAMPYPPGPQPLPFIGNALDFPTEQEWLVFRKWNEQYGNVVYTEALGRKMVVLGSASVVSDLLERKSAIYSDRPHLVMTLDLMECDWALVMTPYGDHWRRGRKLMHTYMHAGVALKFHPVQIVAARRLVLDLLAAPQQSNVLPKVVRLNVGQTIIKIVYGIDVKDAESKFISTPEQFNELVTESMMPGRFLVDLIPALRHVPAWMPGAGFKEFARKATVLSQKLRDDPITVVKAAMADKTAGESMVRSMLDDHISRKMGSSSSGDHDESADEQLIKDIAAMAYGAGADTTVSSIVSFFLAMLVYPDVQIKAQAEIDRVVGQERLPEMNDMNSLPYINAVVTECLRWLTVLPMGVPHMTSVDDEYKGYFIPKGTVVLGSIWAILHHPDEYPEPEAFKPERYLTKTLAGGYVPNPDAPDPRITAFGFGRRICPGRYMANASIFASVATVLATMSIVRPKDVEGQDIVPEVAQSSGFISHPKPFEYVLEYRSAKSRALLEAALEHSAEH